MEFNMKKYAMILAILILAAGCAKKEIRDELQANQAAAKVEILQSQLKTCEKNGGLQRISSTSSGVTVVCKNGVQTWIFI
jgi:PBP1b-binding outer membrane lipoprotein LpoB